MHIVLFLLFGLMVGVLARMTMSGRETGWFMSLVVGILGAFIGGFLGADGVVGGYVMSFTGAVLVSVAYRVFIPHATA